MDQHLQEVHVVFDQVAAEAVKLGHVKLVCCGIQGAIHLCTCIQIHGNIIQAITKEEHDAMLAKVRRAFGKKR